MLKNKTIAKQSNLGISKSILRPFSINISEEIKIQKFIDEIFNHNKHTNLVGKSTLLDPWKSHILDSIQIIPFIKHKNSTILDMGTGAGLPGLVLAIIGYTRVSVVDSNGKKIKFIKKACKKLNIKADIFLSRIEQLKNDQYNYLISRALAKLNKLLIYSHNLINRNSVLIFLKGKTVNEEIVEAKKNWSFVSELHQSQSDKRGKILIIRNLAPKK